MQAQSAMKESSPIRTPSFEQAMEITVQWLALWDSGELSDEVLADRVGELVASRDGTRGFFVVALTVDGPLMDRLPEPLVAQLRAAGAGVVDLTARNLVMSTAMRLFHQRSGDVNQQNGSKRVQTRSRELLRQLDSQAVKCRLESLLAAAKAKPEDAAKMSDGKFMDRFGYDLEQRQAIAEAINAVAE